MMNRCCLLLAFTVFSYGNDPSIVIGDDSDPPTLLWTYETGNGYAAPAIADGRLDPDDAQTAADIRVKGPYAALNFHF